MLENQSLVPKLANKFVTKQRLARAYNICSATFANYLNNGQLFEKLEKAGYVKTQKVLSPSQIKVIVEHLGEFE